MRAEEPSMPPLEEFSYDAVRLASPPHESQLQETLGVLMNLSEDSLLKPFRQMAGQPAPGEDLGGWYLYNPGYDWHTQDAGFAPGATFGQWVSALARYHKITGSEPVRAKVLRLNQFYAKALSGDFYEKSRFPAYCYDKLVGGLVDAHQFAGDPNAFAILEQTTDTALPYLPKTAVDRELEWRPGKDQSFRWDESYTNPENLFIAFTRGAGARYSELGIRFLDDQTYFDPLAKNHNVLGGKHAYSYVNALNSAMQAYFVLGSDKHFRAAKNGFAMLTAQSFATGGWGPDEMLRTPDSDDLVASLTKTHNSFETPCGSYAHFKLTRYLLRATRDSKYGDSMERVMYNTVLGAKPIEPDGQAFYYSDYNFVGKKVFSNHRWPCCSGTLPQVAADYRLNTYFRDREGLFVNLYMPSSLRWIESGSRLSLTQSGQYPFENLVVFDLDASEPAAFALNFRIPQWAEGASISINGSRTAAEPGNFAQVYRLWKQGDRIELELPMQTRLEPINHRHADTVALLYGPLVLFPITAGQPVLRRSQLLAARKCGQAWQVETSSGSMKMLPFTAINQETYSTYLRVT